MQLLSKQLKIQVIDEYKKHKENIIGGYCGIYSVIVNNSIFIAFIPKFERNTDQWYMNLPDLKLRDDEYEAQEARIIRAVVAPNSITPSEKKAGTKEVFSLPTQFEYPALKNKKPYKRTVYYVKPEEFYTFRGELATITDTTKENGDFIQIKELEDFEFVKYIFNNILINER